MSWITFVLNRLTAGNRLSLMESLIVRRKRWSQVHSVQLSVIRAMRHKDQTLSSVLIRNRGRHNVVSILVQILNDWTKEGSFLKLTTPKQEDTVDGLLKWSHMQWPTCEPLTCTNQLPELENGQIKCWNGDQVGKHCSVQCDIGYELSPESESTVLCGRQGSIK